MSNNGDLYFEPERVQVLGNSSFSETNGDTAQF